METIPRQSSGHQGRGPTPQGRLPRPGQGQHPEAGCCVGPRGPGGRVSTTQRPGAWRPEGGVWPPVTWTRPVPENCPAKPEARRGERKERPGPVTLFRVEDIAPGARGCLSFVSGACPVPASLCPGCCPHSPARVSPPDWPQLSPLLAPVLRPVAGACPRGPSRGRPQVCPMCPVLSCVLCCHRVEWCPLAQRNPQNLGPASPMTGKADPAPGSQGGCKPGRHQGADDDVAPPEALLGGRSHLGTAHHAGPARRPSAEPRSQGVAWGPFSWWPRDFGLPQDFCTSSWVLFKGPFLPPPLSSDSLRARAGG